MNKQRNEKSSKTHREEFAPANGDGSITGWLVEWRNGNGYAAQRIVERYKTRLRHSAGQKVGSPANQDAEHLAMESINALLLAISQGKHEDLSNRTDLMNLLTKILAYRVIDRYRRGAAEIRGGHMQQQAVHSGLVLMEDAPEAVPEAMDELQKVMNLLPTENLRTACDLRIKGLTIDEISKKMQVSVPTIERYLRRIREIWSEVLSP